MEKNKKQYKLLHDLPSAPIGTVLTLNKEGYYIQKDWAFYSFSKHIVENNPDWFEKYPPEEEKSVKIREYCEGIDVEIITGEVSDNKGRLCIKAKNEAGHNWVEVDLLDVIDWLRENKPGLLL